VRAGGLDPDVGQHTAAVVDAVVECVRRREAGETVYTPAPQPVKLADFVKTKEDRQDEMQEDKKVVDDYGGDVNGGAEKGSQGEEEGDSEDSGDESGEEPSAAPALENEDEDTAESLVEGFVTSRLLRRLVLSADQASDAVATQLLECLQSVGGPKGSLAQWCDGHGAKVVAALLHHSATRGAVEKCIPKTKLAFLRDLNAKHTKFTKPAAK